MRRPLLIRVYKNVKLDGGVQTRLMEMLPRLKEHLDVRLLCYRYRGERAAELEALGIPVDWIPLGMKWAPWNVRRYVEYFRHRAPDIVHTHEYTANTLAINAASMAGVPVRIRHLHTMAPWGWGGRVRTALRVAADRRAARISQQTLAVSGAVRRLYLERTGLPADSCRVLYNGLDLSRFRDCRSQRTQARTALGLPVDAPIAGVVGRLSRGKGHREFLELARIVAAGLPEVRFLVVGSGDLRPELEALASRWGLAEKVLFTGHRDDVPELLSAMDLFVFPSAPDEAGRIQDGLPGAVIEAQAAGLPVVAFGLPMMAEIIEAGRTGALVPVGDVDGAAAACLAYLSDSGRSREVSAAAQRSAERFSLDVCAETTLALYEEFLRCGKRP